MKKALFVFTHTALGGGEVLILRIIFGIDKSKIIPIVAISKRNIRIAEALKRENIKFITLPDTVFVSENKIFKMLIQLPNFLWLNILIGWIIAKHRPNIVHAGLFYSALFSVVPAKLFGCRFVWAALTPTDLIRYPFLSKILMRFADKTMLPCADFIRIAKGNNMPGIEKMQVIYTGMKEEEFIERKGSPILHIGERNIMRPIVALIARYDEAQKGHKYFWEMARAVHKKFPNVNFVVAGGASNSVEEEFKNRLDVLTKEMGLTENLFCVGSVKDIPEFLSNVDIVVVSSVYESPSAVVQEAGAAAKPVVAFRVGGIPEVLNDGEGGFLVPFPDVVALTEKVIMLLTDQELAQTMGKNGKVFTYKHFREKNFIELYESMYTSLL